VMHNTGLNTCTSSLYIYPSGVSDVSVGQTAYRLARVDLASNETFFFEPAYPITLTATGDTLQVYNEGSPASNSVNVLVLGDKEV